MLSRYQSIDPLQKSHKPARATGRIMRVLPPATMWHTQAGARKCERRYLIGYFLRGCPFLIPLLCTGSVDCYTNALLNLVELCHGCGAK
ncbi:unnamed protein product [Ixodes hexagonus]